ncbi:MAG: ATP-binding cassette domain-containing protein [Xanthobacteraceae bacterium]|nr:ATP-binding cassette domain-containing protein [Xanthobacteraceae bacterium]MBX3522206.1 ATP-binding cassette domain-containing protein [Xanthobacteraceae bacterium]MBX3535413.1 ATP-binding cassette domain-containing protein [Xanthobacteraceae bacterium]MBX3548891.1 ATP-binding cassette domain-containing protein [Xanthobacteraceae bacterium]MCW5674522.1 ATP-binding cassette domain-containing protein [Xanthobacteraceae bacterium]
MFEAKSLQVSIKSIEILRGVDLKIGEGEMVGLVGRNGAGKTTTMRTLMGILPLRAGDIVFQGKSINSLSSDKRAALGIGYMPEDRRLVPQLTVEENILLPAWAMKHLDQAARLQLAYDLLPEIAAMRDRRALLLSGGQQKLVALARAIMAGTNLLLLDEPFEGVAPALSQRLSEVIGALRGQKLSVLIAQSDSNHSAKLLDRKYTIERGANVN